jgi:hypothetical protein
MVQIFGRHYLTTQGCGDKDAAVVVMRAMAKQLENLVRDNKISSFMVYTLYDEETILDSFLEVQEVMLFSDNKLPVVHVNISFRLEHDNDSILEALETVFELKLFKAFTMGK